jgi:hypothetical protein
MPKKSVKKPTKTLDLDCKIDAIKSEIDEIDKEHVAVIPNVPNVPNVPDCKKEQKQHFAKPKVIEEIIEEDEPEPIIIRKIIKKKPQKIIEEIVQEDEPEPEPELEKPKKKDGRGRPVGSYKKPRDTMELSQKQKYQQQAYNMLDETNLQMLKNDMQKEMRRRLMNSLFD